MADERPRCGKCGRILTVIPGHRARRYCNDTCKQGAYRRRRSTATHQKRQESRMTQLEKLYPGLSFYTYYALASFKYRPDDAVMQTIVTVIRKEKEATVRQVRKEEGRGEDDGGFS